MSSLKPCQWWNLARTSPFRVRRAQVSSPVRGDLHGCAFKYVHRTFASVRFHHQKGFDGIQIIAKCRAFFYPHQSWRLSRHSPEVASSANQACLIPSRAVDSIWISGMVAWANIAIARGSPWVVPSCDRRTAPPTKKASVVSVGVDQDGSKGWTDEADVQECQFPVEVIEGVWCIHEHDGVAWFVLEDRFHAMDGSFGSCLMTGA